MPNEIQYNKLLLDLDELRRDAGAILKSWRKSKGILQGDLAKIIKIKDGSFISQIEAGNRRVPPELFEAYAEALDVDPRKFAMVLMQHYDPYLYDIIFSKEEKIQQSSEEKTAK